MELTNSDPEQKQKNLMELDKVVSGRIPIITSSVTVTLAEQAGWVKHPARLIGLGAFPTFLEGSLVELCTAEGKETSMVADTTGLVLPRIVCMLVNEAYFAMMEGVAPAREIDTAMKLGTNYPRGPVEWAERIGLHHVYAVLSALHASFGEDRYRVAPLLLRSMRQAAGGV
jgi:3-hydroxybutyryl-CoA dehydrogenase